MAQNKNAKNVSESVPLKILLYELGTTIKWVSLPAGQHFQEPCNTVTITAPDYSYISHLLQTIRYSYSKARYFEKEWSGLREAIEKPLFSCLRLIDINESII